MNTVPQFKIIALTLLLLVPARALDAKPVIVRLFASAKPESVVFTPVAGIYELEIPDAPVMKIAVGEPVLIFKYGKGIAVKTRMGAGLISDSLNLKGSQGAGFSLSTTGSGSVNRFYHDDLTCRLDDGIFLILNLTSLEKFIPGVVRSEGGAGRSSEFYKVQAVITRTFAYRNLLKHKSDGYNICDDVHCQAYHGVTHDQAILDAVTATTDTVITDKDSILIMAAFHSNCGGETASAAEAWVSELPYLKKVIDPYCKLSRNAQWSKIISTESWLTLLVNSGYQGLLSDSLLVKFSQTDKRKQYFEPVAGVRLSTTDIRTALGLRSSFFSINPSGDSLIISGRGYGHGVGLCQEGAMVMALRGFTLHQILDFYYSDIKLMTVKDTKLPPTVY
jgi:stage II sporulation protein D